MPHDHLTQAEFIEHGPSNRVQASIEPLSTSARHASVPYVFAEQRRRTPNAIALVQGQQSLTYRELDDRSIRIARRLLDLGLGPGSRIGTFVARTTDTVAALLAILRIGAAYVPLEPTYPAAVLHQAMMMSDIAAMIVHESLWNRVPNMLGWDGPLLRLDADLDAINNESAEPLREPAVQPDDLAYIMFTSGSTGRPKGVMIPHRGIVRLVCNTNYADFGPDQVFLFLAPLAFDASTFEIWGPLLNGARLVLPLSHLPSVDEVADTIQRHGVTTLWLTSGLFHLIVDQHIDALTPLRQLLAGGDVLSPAHIEKARRALPACQLINGYGPTENTTFTCCYAIPRDQEVNGAIPIGVPVAQTTVRLLDEAYRPVLDGEVGQLCTGGAGLALGYLDDQDLTARKFITDPQDPGSRLYLTGDLARRDADGILHFLGRADRQIKINGKRLELEEVENALRSHPEVRDAAVLLRDDRAGPKRLVAYLSGVPDTQQMIEALRGFLRARVAEHAVPADFIMLDVLPLSPTGKLDRDALRRIPAKSSSKPITQSDAVQSALAKLFGQVLGLDDVSVTTNFFDLGGTSLQLLEAVERIRSSLYPGLKTGDIFEHPTVKDLAAFIRGRNAPPQIKMGHTDRGRRGNDGITRLQQRRARPTR